ncbi:uncharacterized protein LOC115267114 [Aedes albopictus]|uniref:BEN domain-containing protein n=1 Tax=Aedes albopictus TaxID=7160 RepID=A0ABM2A7Z2_AEDAL
MGRKRTTAAKKRVLRSATAKNIDFLVKKLPELQDTALQSPPAKKRVAFQSGIDVHDVGCGRDMVNIDEQFEKDIGHISSDSDDDDSYEAPKPHPLKPSTRTYRRRITIDELLEEWQGNESDREPNPSTINKETESNLNEPSESEPVAETSEFFGCTCGKAEEAQKYKTMYESLLNEMTDKESSAKEKLLKDNAELAARNAKLQAALTSKLLPHPEEPFKDVSGNFLDAGTIRQLSIEADSDYLFIKFVMMRLWPDGFAGRSVTGRRSNNPFGRSKSQKSTDKTTDVDETAHPGPSSVSANTSADGTGETTKRPLEKEKVDFVIACLYRRRVFLQDDPHAAQVRTKAGISLMTRVIANSTRK